eukprot:TRINITY_DN2572_c1_g1_i1.p1 TRINITY_DN2572_c1_g1~~TRINITY_DN2572_c1_g1_i1.p1  ORF type:complete len:689 (+),score=213.91 TRINITY_DN2572_c1_g1_i1:81-2069(+)
MADKRDEKEGLTDGRHEAEGLNDGVGQEPAPKPPKSLEEKQYMRGVYLLLTVATFDAIEYGLIMPSLYGYIEEATGSEQSALYGLVIATFSIASLLTRPWLGAWADRQGFRVVYAITIAIATAGNIVYAFGAYASSVAPIFVGRTLSGIGCANTAMVYAYISRCVPDNRRSVVTQLGGFGFVFGLMLGPALNAITGALDFEINGFRVNENNSPSLLVAALMIVQGTLIVTLLREPPPYAARVKLTTGGALAVTPLPGRDSLAVDGGGEGCWEVLPAQYSKGEGKVTVRWLQEGSKPGVLQVNEMREVVVAAGCQTPGADVWCLECSGQPRLVDEEGSESQRETNKLRLLLPYLFGGEPQTGSDTAVAVSVSPLLYPDCSLKHTLDGNLEIGAAEAVPLWYLKPELTKAGQVGRDLKEIAQILFCDPAVFACVCVVFGFNLKINATEALLVPVTKQAFNWNAQKNSFVYGAMALEGLILNMFAFKKVLPAFKDQERWVVVIGQVIYAGGLVLCLVLWTADMAVWHFVVGYGVMMGALPFVFSPNRAIFSRAPSVSHSRHQALLSQLLSVFASLGSIAGPLWLGATYDGDGSGSDSSSGGSTPPPAPVDDSRIAPVTLYGLAGVTVLNTVVIGIAWFLRGNPILDKRTADYESPRAKPKDVEGK